MNVDQINPDFLEALSSALCSAEHAMDAEEAEQLCALLVASAGFLESLALSKRHRLEGAIGAAKVAEHYAERKYAMLPEAAQW